MRITRDNIRLYLTAEAFPLLAFTLLLCLGTIVLKYSEHWSWRDAMYGAA